ncbi:hypothetical protein PYCCODRAFT_1437475, partial [Trametes coccinea BRFM310]
PNHLHLPRDAGHACTNKIIPRPSGCCYAPCLNSEVQLRGLTLYSVISVLHLCLTPFHFQFPYSSLSRHSTSPLF